MRCDNGDIRNCAARDCSFARIETIPLTVCQTDNLAHSQRLAGAFTVDVEDYFQVTAFEGHISRDSWPDYESRVVGSTQKTLDLLARHGVRGTFFILGWVAEHYPQLVRDIHRAGHEIASHSHWHRLVYQMTAEQFREDLRRSRNTLEDLIGEPVVAYRAPTFSITSRSVWAIEILIEEGFRVDSSIFPIYHDRYGIPGASREIHRIRTPSGSLWEYPPTVARIGRFNFPAGGGGYFRLYPYAFSRFCLERVSRRGTHPFMFYVHPWELDPDQPRLSGSSRASRFRHYVSLSRTEAKLGRLLSEFRCGRICDIIPLHDQ